MRCAWPSRYSVSVVSSVRQTMRSGYFTGSARCTSREALAVLHGKRSLYFTVSARCTSRETLAVLSREAVGVKRAREGFGRLADARAGHDEQLAVQLDDAVVPDGRDRLEHVPRGIRRR